MKQVSNDFVSRMNQPIRETTKVNIEFMSADSSVECTWDDNIAGLGDTTWNNGKTDAYIATLCLNGTKVGDHNCRVQSKLSSMIVRDKALQTVVLTSDIAGSSRIAEGIPASDTEKISIAFQDLIPNMIEVQNYGSGETQFKFFRNLESVNTLDLSDLTDGYFRIIFHGGTVGQRFKIALFTKNEYTLFDNSNLINVDHLIAIDLISATLPTNKLVFNAYDANGMYDPANPNGVYDKFSRGDKVVVKYGYDGEMITYSYNFLDDLPTWDDGMLTMTTVSDLALHTDTMDWGWYDLANNVGETLPSYEVAEFSVGNVDFTHKSGEVMSTAIIEDTVEKQIAQLMANAYVGYINPTTKPAVFYPSDSAMSASLTGYHMKSKDMLKKYPKVSMSNVLKGVKYSINDNKVGSSFIEYTIPSVSLVGTPSTATVALPDNFNASAYVEVTNVPSGVNVYKSRYEFDHVDVQFTASEPMTLTNVKVKAYLKDVTATTTRIVKNDIGEVMDINNPFITDVTDISTHSNKVASVYTNRQVFEVEYSQDFRLEVGDVILIDTKYENDVKIIITELHYKLPGRWGVLKGRRLE